jgi:hypothetical protein
MVLVTTYRMSKEQRPIPCSVGNGRISSAGATHPAVVDSSAECSSPWTMEVRPGYLPLRAPVQLPVLHYLTEYS